MVKACIKCGEVKQATAEYFPKYKRGPRGACLICFRAQVNATRKRNSESGNARRREYLKENKETIHAQKKIYRDNNKKSISEHYKLWRKQNIQKVAENHRVYFMNNKDKTNISSHNRRAMLRELPHTLTETQWNDIKLFFGNSCAYCGEKNL